MSSLSFTKLFSSITESTVWCEPYHTRILWVAMLAMADRKGCVHASVPGLARRAGITLDECNAALASFMGPDPYSRTKEYDGRRIEEVDGGWRLLNHAKYREMRDEEAKRDADAERQRRHRAAKQSPDDTLQPGTPSADRHAHAVTERDSHAKSHEVAQAEAEAEAEKEEQQVSPPAAPTPAGADESESPDSGAVGEPRDPIPYVRIAKLYNEILSELPAVTDVTGTRRATLRARWNEKKNRQSLEWWGRYFRHVSKSDYLTGKKKSFRATFDWLIAPSNMVKVIEGNYHDPEPANA